MHPPPFDLESGVRVTCDRDVGYLCANSSLPRPLCSRLWPDVRDRRQTASSLNAPPIGAGIIMIMRTSGNRTTNCAKSKVLCLKSMNKCKHRPKLVVICMIMAQGRNQGWPKPPQSPPRKNIRQKQLILFTTFTLHIKLYSELQWMRNALNVLRYATNLLI